MRIRSHRRRSTRRNGMRCRAPRRRSCVTSSCSHSRRRGCATPHTGWDPRTSSCATPAARWPARCPLYLKSHSWGEFVFDFAWAEAYQPRGLQLLPASSSRAVPFTPATGPRLLAAGDRRRARPWSRRRARSRVARRFPRCTCCFRSRDDRDTLRSARVDAAPRLPVSLAQRRLRARSTISSAGFTAEKRKKAAARTAARRANRASTAGR